MLPHLGLYSFTLVPATQLFRLVLFSLARVSQSLCLQPLETSSCAIISANVWDVKDLLSKTKPGREEGERSVQRNQSC